MVYELIWIRQATLIFGSASLAIATVTGVFFAGMSAGSYWFGKKSQTNSNPIKMYGIIEILTGIWVILTPLLFFLLRIPFSFSYNLLGSNFYIVSVVRIMVVAALFMPPAFLMGGTLPLLVRYFVNSENKILKSVGNLSSINTIGAFFGTLTAGFLLIPHLGMYQTLIIGGAIDIFIGIYLLKKATPGTFSQPSEELHKTKEPEFSLRHIPLYFVFMAIGFSVMAHEVLWTRFLSLLVHNTVYTYTLTLSSILFGLATGYFLISAISKRIKDHGFVFGVITIFAALFVTVFTLLPHQIIQGIVAEQSALNMVVLCVLLFMIPAVLSGMLFPLAVKMSAKSATTTSYTTGFLSAVNIAGGVLGAFITGFILLPLTGIQITLAITTGILLIAGSYTLFAFSQKLNNIQKTCTVAVSVLVWVIYPMFIGAKVPHDYLKSRGELVAVYEGIGSFLSVIQEGNNKILEIDKMWQGEERKNRQFMAAHIPMMLHQSSPSNVAVIGTGVGQTASRFLKYDIDSLFCVDIEREILPIIQQHFPSNWTEDPRVRFLSEDGRLFLSNTDKMFDLISIEIGQTFRPNLSSFYTREFYRECKKRLNEGGIVSQFLPIASFDYDHFKSAVSTFISVFPNTVLWYNESEFLLIGSVSSTPTFSLDRFSSRLSDPELYDDLSFSYFGGPRQYVNNPYIFTAGFLCGPSTLAQFTENSPVFTDNNPRLEYFAARNQTNEHFLDSIIPLFDDPDIIWSDITDTMITAVNFMRRLHVSDIITQSLLTHYEQHGEKIILRQAHKINPLNFRAIFLLAEEYKKRGDMQEAIRYYKEASKIRPDNHSVHFNLAMLYQREKELQNAIEQYERVVRIKPTNYMAFNNLGVIHAQKGSYREAANYFQRAIDLNPDYQSALRNYKALMMNHFR
ncbi:Spermidine synthase [Chitinispirillum alkaliphilum]|nr:Spermidine synthase [Chitinispirillum alkaliphilum]